MKLHVKVFDFFIFGNFFIAICAASMVQSTYTLNGVKSDPSFISFFIANSTFLLYNFHHISFQLDYTSLRSFFRSLFSYRFLLTEKIFLISSILVELFHCFFLRPETLILLLIIAIPASLYSIPFFGKNTIRRSLRQWLFLKIPLLAFVWSFSTVIIPLIEAGSALNVRFLCLQLASRFCFIFALCIPFELRDVEFDSGHKIKTLPIAFGERITQWIGIFVVIMEILIHHFAFYLGFVSFDMLFVLDISSVIAITWIVLRHLLHGKYFYKLLVDGTMIIRYLLILAIYQV